MLIRPSKGPTLSGVRSGQLSSRDVDQMEMWLALKARDNFWAFRRYMNPTMKATWWPKEVAFRLQDFYDQYKLGLRPMAVIEAPPQHGKSVTIIDFIAWLIGKEPDMRNIFASFSDRLGVRANRAIQRLMDSDKYKKVFPEVGLDTGSGAYVRNRELLEIVGKKGYFRNTTVRGSVTGESLDAGFIDDPLKGRLEANSESVRNNVWEWFTDDFLTRFSEFACLLIVLTRWHIDDPVGRLKEEFPELQVFKYPAIATQNERFRRQGEALVPELKSLEFLLARKRILSEASFESLYQQSPFVATGEIFPIDNFRYEQYVRRDEIKKSVRYWDKAGTKDGDGAETSGTLMHMMKDKTFVIEHVAHGRWGALERERMIQAWAKSDNANNGRNVRIFVEQEPGSGGKESAEATIRNLAGYLIEADRPTGDKATRAEPYAAQVQGKNVVLIKGEWNKPFIDQHQYFPNGALKDMVDSSSGAFNKLYGHAYDIEALNS